MRDDRRFGCALAIAQHDASMSQDDREFLQHESDGVGDSD